MVDAINKHVFIVTYGRSGSTVLQRVLQSIPGYFIRGENNHTLYPMYLAYRRAYEARHTHGRSPHVEADPWYGANEINPRRFGRQLCRVFSRQILQPPEGTRVAGFKEIRFHEAGEELFSPYLDFIAANFPGTRFIFNMRSWEAVSRSSWWATMDPDLVRGIISGADKLYQAYAKAHPDYCYTMRYEEFNGNPAAFEPLFEFLGEPFSEPAIAELLDHKLKHSMNVAAEDGPKETYPH
jgi:hypothetical protein